MNDCYKNAMEHLRFSDDLAERVRNAPKRKKSNLRVIRILSLAAVLCALLAVTVMAEGGWFRRNTDIVDLGKETVDVSDAGIMEIRVVHNYDGIDTYSMELPANIRYIRNGMLSDGRNAFCRINEDYTIEKLEAESVTGCFEKNGRTYRVSLCYIRQNDEIIAGTLVKYPVENGEVLLNAFCAPNHNWPVYVNLETGEIRDAFAAFDTDDFAGHVGYVDHFRGGLLVSGISEGTDGDSRQHLYWVKDQNSDPIPITMLEDYYAVEDDYLYFYNSSRNTRIHYSGADGEVQLLEGSFQTGSGPDRGLFTVRHFDGTLGIADVINQTVFSIPEISVSYQDLDYRRIHASRNNVNGKIVLTSIGLDRENGIDKMNFIGYLDQTTGVMKILEVDSNYGVRSFGWMDDDRYAVIYEDGLRQYLYISELK